MKKNDSFETKHIIDDDGTVSSSSSVHISDVQKLYTHQTHELIRPHKSRAAFVILWATVFALGAGGIAALAIQSDAFGILSRFGVFSGDAGRTVVIEKQNLIQVPWQEGKEKIFSRISASVTGVYAMEGDTKNISPDSQTGNAIILSSDGWVVTVTNAMPDSNREYGVEHEGRVVPIQSRIDDPVSPLVFLKVAETFSSPTAGAQFPVRVGDMGFVSAHARRNIIGAPVFIVDPRHISHTIQSGPEDLVRRIATTPLGLPMIPGSGLFHASGELIGIAEGVDMQFIPAPFVNTLVPSLVKSGMLGRRFIGVSGYAADQYLVRGTDTYSSGFVLTHIEPGSPALRAGLRRGDTITKVENEYVGVGGDFFELMQEYPPNTTVILEVERAGEILQVSLVLAEDEDL